jgi:ATP diphosphatase
MPDEKQVKLPATKRLLNIMEQLRDPEHGCPWDVKQTMQSLTKYTIEETYEVVDAIENKNVSEVKDELGDLLFQIVFYARIAQEQQHFCFDDVADAISRKLVRRHPHVFAAHSEGASNLSQYALAKQWEAIKQQEKAHNNNTGESLLDGVPKNMPSLVYAQKLQKACAKVGFDWPNVSPVLQKVEEEVQEVRDELEANTRNQQAVEEEIGDALFAMVNLARHCNLDADTALRKASNKFAARFKQVEALAGEQNTPLADMSLNEMEALWQQVKVKEKASS